MGKKSHSREQKTISWCVLPMMALALSAANINELFEKADNAYIREDDAVALSLYRKVIEDGSHERLVILSEFKTAEIYETRVFDLEKALSLFKNFLEKHPNSPFDRLVKERIEFMERLQSASELKLFGEYKNREATYRRFAESGSSGEKKEAALALYHFAKDNQNCSFSKKMLPNIYATLKTNRSYLLAYDTLEIVLATDSTRAEEYEDELIEIKKQVRRIYIFYTSSALLAFLLLWAVIRGGFKRGAFSVFSKRTVGILLVPLLLLLIYYFVFVTRDLNTRYDLLYFGATTFFMIFAFLLSLMMSNSLKMKNPKSTFLRFAVFGLLIGTMCWCVFAYSFDYLHAIGL